jgi:hypothetical protein
MPSLSVVVVLRKDNLVFVTSCVNFIDECQRHLSTGTTKPSLTVGQFKPCGDKRTRLQLQHAQVFHSKMTGKEYKIFYNVNCKPLMVMWCTSLTVTSAGRNT